MPRLRNRSKAVYVTRAFAAAPGDVIDVTPEEAALLLATSAKTWEVVEDGAKREAGKRRASD